MMPLVVSANGSDRNNEGGSAMARMRCAELPCFFSSCAFGVMGFYALLTAANSNYCQKSFLLFQCGRKRKVVNIADYISYSYVKIELINKISSTLCS